MSGEVPIEIEDKPTAVSIMRELVEHLQDTIEALKREIVRNPQSMNTRRLLRVPANASPSPNRSWHARRQERRTAHEGADTVAMSVKVLWAVSGQVLHNLWPTVRPSRSGGQWPECAKSGRSGSNPDMKDG
jgi:hypothetical protein